jgi:carbonic anhydrase/acetyltransferase-like protein (isoleucine patch superfamily)
VIYQLDDRRVSVDGDFFIADSASVIGAVHLKNDVSVWYGAVVRGDNEPIIVGAGSNVQDLAVLHTDISHPLTIGDNCTVGHKVMLHGCTIGNNTLIGINAVVLNGAVIGNNCLIGAGALVTEGKEIPDGSLVLGSPGRVARSLTAQQIAGLTQLAINYVRNFKRYNLGLSVQDRVDTRGA